VSKQYFKKERKLKIMNKTYTRLWLIAATLGVMRPAFSQENYHIQLCTFTEKIESSFFDFSGFSDVRYKLIAPQYHEYQWGNFSTPQAAESALLSLQKDVSIHGLNNLKIIPSIPDFTIPSASTPTETNTYNADFQLFTRSVNFSNSKLSLKKTDVETLEEVAIILENNPDLKLRIFATNDDNKKKKRKRNISPKSSDIIRNFLLAKNIPAYRIKKMEATKINTNASKSHSKVQQVFMTLVDLKEEIVFDRFGNDGYIAKKIRIEKTLSSLE